MDGGQQEPNFSPLERTLTEKQGGNAATNHVVLHLSQRHGYELTFSVLQWQREGYR